jgi:ribosomal protein S6
MNGSKRLTSKIIFFIVVIIKTNSTILYYFNYNLKKFQFMQVLRKYEIMILLTEEFNDNELKSWVFNYAKTLRKFNVCDISVISRGKHKLSYSILNKSRGNYIQLNFASIPKYVKVFLDYLKTDSKVLRAVLLKKQ